MGMCNILGAGPVFSTFCLGLCGFFFFFKSSEHGHLSRIEKAVLFGSPWLGLMQGEPRQKGAWCPAGFRLVCQRTLTEDALLSGIWAVQVLLSIFSILAQRCDIVSAK